MATVLFADVASSTALIGDRDAEEARRILKPIVDIMVDIVHRYEGITRAEGDGLMASFGVPIALEDHALRACYAALDIQEAMRSHAVAVREEVGTLIQARVGINSGPVAVTVNYQDGSFIDFRADGMPTHVAKRLESVTTPGSIFLTHDTLVLAEGFIAVTALGSVPFKGVAKAVEIYELQGVKARTRIHARVATGLSKFIGRKLEIERLGAAAAQVEQGRGQGVGLVGEPGVGKSRLFLEFTRSLQTSGWLILETGSVPYGRTTSYRPLIDLLSNYFDIQRGDDDQLIRERIAKKLLVLGEDKLVAQMPWFVGALGKATSEHEWMKLTPPERQNMLFDASKRLFIREAQNQPLCLIFEDLHWFDVETELFLKTLLDGILAARILLLVNHRLEYENRWTGGTNYSELRIDPLPADSAYELLESLLGADANLHAIKDELLRATQGNPLFLEEGVRSLIDSNILVKGSSGFHPTGSIPSDFVPRNVDSLLAARIDRLDSLLKEILQCAAVIGNDVSLALLQDVTKFAEAELARGLETLRSKEFLYEKSLFPELQYSFKHAMMREVAYGSLLRDRRAALHARAALSLERLMSGRLEQHVVSIAEHAEKGRIWDKALNYLQLAGSKSYFLYANADAAGYFERALKAIKQLPKTRLNDERTVDIYFELRNALLPLGEIDRTLKCLDEVEPILIALDDKSRSARYAAFRCNHHFLAGEQRRAIEFGGAGLRSAREGSDRVMEGELLHRLGQSYHALGEYPQAIALLQQSLKRTVDEGNRLDLFVLPSVVNRTWLVSALVERGDLVAGMANAKRALEAAEYAKHPPSQVLGWLSIGRALARKSELQGAVAALERGLDLCNQWSLRVWRPRLTSLLGVAYARTGRHHEGLELARQALADAERMRLVVDRPSLLVHLGQASLVANHLDDALAIGQQATAIAAAHEARGDEAWARFLIARTRFALEPQDLDECIKQLDAAFGLAQACGSRPLAAYCQQIFGEVHARHGDHDAARRLSIAAHHSFAELGMLPLPIYPLR
jgi:class 3 adenylate cyclase/tetratricopeptide (TPR) repeat protein